VPIGGWSRYDALELPERWRARIVKRPRRQWPLSRRLPSHARRAARLTGARPWRMNSKGCGLRPKATATTNQQISTCNRLTVCRRRDPRCSGRSDCCGRGCGLPETEARKPLKVVGAPDWHSHERRRQGRPMPPTCKTAPRPLCARTNERSAMRRRQNRNNHLVHSETAPRHLYMGGALQRAARRGHGPTRNWQSLLNAYVAAHFTTQRRCSATCRSAGRRRTVDRD